MFIGNPKFGLEPRMNADQREAYHHKNVQRKYCERNYDAMPSADSCIWAYEDSMKNEIEIAFRNHPRPQLCDCGNYPEIVPVGLVGSHIGIGCLKCGKKLGKDFLYKAFNSKNEAFIAWNEMITEERENG